MQCELVAWLKSLHVALSSLLACLVLRRTGGAGSAHKTAPGDQVLDTAQLFVRPREEEVVGCAPARRVVSPSLIQNCFVCHVALHSRGH
jgi:hypothetical protein